MKRLTYNDMEFSIEEADGRWNIAFTTPDGKRSYAAAGLFEGAPESEIEALAARLIGTLFPVGIRVVGPDVAHPNLIGDLKIVGPDVAHPNFIYWDKESASFPK